MKRTTVVLTDQDQENLAAVALGLGAVSDMEAIRRSLRLTRRILELHDDVEVIVDGVRTRILIG